MIMKKYSRQLRKNLTDAENKLWYFLRLRQIAGLKFRRQAPIGRYIADFVCYEIGIIIEVDGSQHDNSKYDLERSLWLNSQGFRVYRFWNNDVLTNIEGVIEVILEACMNNSFPPILSFPHKGGRDHSIKLFVIHQAKAK